MRVEVVVYVLSIVRHGTSGRGQVLQGLRQTDSRRPAPPTAETPTYVAAPPPAAPLPGYPVQPQAAAGPRRNKTPIIIGLAALAVVIIVVVVILVFTLGGDGGVAGTYSNTEGWSHDRLQLKPDGTFTFSEDISIPVEGTYEVNGNKLIMHMKMFDLAYTYDVEGPSRAARSTSMERSTSNNDTWIPCRFGREAGAGRDKQQG